MPTARSVFPFLTASNAGGQPVGVAQRYQPLLARLTPTEAELEALLNNPAQTTIRLGRIGLGLEVSTDGMGNIVSETIAPSQFYGLDALSADKAYFNLPDVTRISQAAAYRGGSAFGVNEPLFTKNTSSPGYTPGPDRYASLRQLLRPTTTTAYPVPNPPGLPKEAARPEVAPVQASATLAIYSPSLDPTTEARQAQARQTETKPAIANNDDGVTPPYPPAEQYRLAQPLFTPGNAVEEANARERLQQVLQPLLAQSAAAMTLSPERNPQVLAQVALNAATAQASMLRPTPMLAGKGMERSLADSMVQALRALEPEDLQKRFALDNRNNGSNSPSFLSNGSDNPEKKPRHRKA